MEKDIRHVLWPGDLSNENEDYSDIFTSDTKFDTIKSTTALAGTRMWQVHHFDVKTTFLNGILKDKVYMYQSRGFEVPSSENSVCKLDHALYGLKQAPRVWF